MSRLFGPAQRRLQDKFDTRRIADKVEAIALHDSLSEGDRAFIAGRDMFFLSSVDAQGMPTVSYKGGAPGFVRTPDEKTLVFPSYDGNGMFLSLGNLAATAKVGLLFIDFETPNRIRVQGEARLDTDPTALADWPGAQLLVRVTVQAVWPNCPRYIHRYRKETPSRYVPRPEDPVPLAGWKRIDLLQDDLPAADQGRAAREGGTISIETWFGQVACGDPEA